MKAMTAPLLLGAAFSLAVGGAVRAEAWAPTRPVEFVVTSSPGGGTDNFARMVQSIIAKYKLMDQPAVVQNKGGGSGAEGYIYAKVSAGDPYKLTFGTNNEYLLPYVAKLGYKADDLTPVAALALDEFVLWVNANAPYKDAKSYIAAAKDKPQTLKMGGSQSKDVDETLTSLIESAAGAKFIYVPFKGGGDAAVQLAGAHIDSNVNNPSENIGQWKAGAVRPLCVFSPSRLAGTAKVTADMGWSDIPTCTEAGVPVDQFQMPRTVWLPGKVPPEAVAFYAGLLKKVSETPEWKDYIEKTSQTSRFLAGKELARFIADDNNKSRQVFEWKGWLVQ